MNNSNFRVSVFLVLLSFSTLSVFALQPDPAKGIYEIGKISTDDIHRYFCQTYEGKKGVVLNDDWQGIPWRHSSCIELVKKVKSRLQVLATGEVTSVVDAEFIKEIAHISRIPDKGNHGYRAGDVSYDIRLATNESLLEFQHIAKEIHEMSRSELYIRTELADYKKQSKLIARFLKIDNISENKYYIDGIESKTIKQFIEGFTIKINSMMANIVEHENLDDIERNLIYLSRLFLSAHPFLDGNTRTTLILMNFMRLYLGLQPYEAYYIPDLRHNSALSIQKAFEEK